MKRSRARPTCFLLRLDTKKNVAFGAVKMAFGCDVWREVPHSYIGKRPRPWVAIAFAMSRTCCVSKAQPGRCLMSYRTNYCTLSNSGHNLTRKSKSRACITALPYYCTTVLLHLENLWQQLKVKYETEFAVYCITVLIIAFRVVAETT